MTEIAELKPCPFCGGKFKMSQEPHDNGYVADKYYIYHEYGPVGSAARDCIIDVRQHFNTADEAVAAWNRRAVSPSPVVVKALEWEAIEQDRGDGSSDVTGDWEALSILGVYTINISVCGDMHAPWEVFGPDDGKLGNYETFKEAKAAAQADYEKRIRAALATPDDGRGE